MRIIGIGLLHLCYTVVVTVVLIACGEKNTEQKNTTVIRPAKLITIEAAGSRQLRRYPAVISAAKSSELAFQVSGFMQELLVIEAQAIQKNDVIARLDQRNFQSARDSAQAQFDNAQQEYQRALLLIENNAIARSVLEQRKSQRDVAKAQLDTAAKALSDTVLLAPFSGVIAKVFAESLQNVQAGTPIATLMSEGDLEASINVPASLVAKIPSRTDRTAFVILDAAPESQILATFKEAALEADPVSQTYEAKFSFVAPKDLIILPGMNATIVIGSSAIESIQNNEVLVPLPAILAEADRLYVWVVDMNTMMISKRAITIKQGMGETITVTNGLAAGETIVAAGVSFLASGMQVRPWSKQ